MVSLFACVASLLVIYVFLKVIVYGCFMSPLARIPGPLVGKFSNLWLAYHDAKLDQGLALRELHDRYGPVVRVGANQVSFSEPDALAPIYVLKGGMPKADYYDGFWVDGHCTMFAERNGAARSVKSKAVQALFSTGNIRDSEANTIRTADKLIARLRQAADTTAARVDLVQLLRAFAVDSTTNFAFHEPFGALDEQGLVTSGGKAEMSLSPFIDGFAEPARWFWVPGGSSGFVCRILTALSGIDMQACEKSMAIARRFAQHLVEGCASGENGDLAIYPARLLKVLSPQKTAVETLDLVYAATDSTSHSLTSIMFHLIENPGVLQRLAAEVRANMALEKPLPLEQLPLLVGVVKEGLRLARVNPVRLTRIVPEGSGWTYRDEFHLPAGTVVGVASSSLHLDASVFPDPHRFDPSRWMGANPPNEYLFAFGRGPRSCIAQNLAWRVLYLVTSRLAADGILERAQLEDHEFRLRELFNSQMATEHAFVRFAAAT